MAVDPNNPDRVFIRHLRRLVRPTRTGTSFNDLTCGYSCSGSAVRCTWTSTRWPSCPARPASCWLGNDGGVHGTTNANAAVVDVDPTWFNMDTGLNTIEFYSGDISGNFATSASPQASGGAQDNGPSSVRSRAARPVPCSGRWAWAATASTARIDPVGTGTSLRFWQGNNSGGLSRCISNCTASGATWTSKKGGWSGDTQSFILPVRSLPRRHSRRRRLPGRRRERRLRPSGRRHHARVGNHHRQRREPNGTVTWYVTNNPSTQNLTKQTLGNRSFINQVKYSPKSQTVAIVGTNDGNVQIGFNLGTGIASQATWVNVTGSNAVLPNRPILGIALDPTTTTAPIGYAAVGGFDANTPSTPGHVFRVDCTTNCASFTWTDKIGQPARHPGRLDHRQSRTSPQQVFAGTDFGLYYTDDITADSAGLAALQRRTAGGDDLGHADRPRLDHALALDARPRRLCLAAADAVEIRGESAVHFGTADSPTPTRNAPRSRR